MSLEDLNRLIHDNREVLIESALETIFFYHWDRNIKISTELSFSILDKIFQNIEKDLKDPFHNKSKFHLLNYYQKILKNKSRIMHDFHIHLALMSAARIVLNHFIYQHQNLLTDSLNVIEFMQRQFDSSLILISKHWGKNQQVKEDQDKKLIEELNIIKNDLQNQLNFIFQIVKRSPVGFVAFDSKLKVIHWNPMAGRITGLQPSDILNNSILTIFDKKSIESFLQVINSSRIWISNQMLYMIRKSGGVFPVLISINKINEPTIENLNYILSFIEISEKTFYASQSKKINQLVTISRLTSAMMHDIRNPLNTLGLMTEVLATSLHQEYNYIPDNINESINKLQNQIHELTKNLNHYLTYTQLAEVNLQMIKFVDYFDNFIEDVRYEAALKKINIIYNNKLNKVFINADWNQLKRVFNNIINNSLEILHDNESIIIDVIKTNNRLKIRIKDNGPGISSENKKKIFDAFFSTKRGGDGLGLFISKEIITAHKGRLVCNSAPGRGTSMTVSLPAITEHDFD
jgi:PAS domain S-box-containing protein